MKKTLFICLIALLGSITAHAAFDHAYSDLESVLNDHLENGRVDYKAIQAAPETLSAQFNQMQAVSREAYDSWSRDEKIAFWLNAYNVSAIKTVIDHYPIRQGFGFKGLTYPKNSIQQIGNVWKRDVIKIFDKNMSLDHIENEILREEFKEPRIHFALVCASGGCPVLREEPYIAGELDKQLDDQVARFLSDYEKFHYNAEKNIVYLSPIFKWFRGDFEASGGILAFVKEYLPNKTQGINDQSSITWLHYDWALNEKK